MRAQTEISVIPSLTIFIFEDRLGNRGRVEISNFKEDDEQEQEEGGMEGRRASREWQGRAQTF